MKRCSPRRVALASAALAFGSVFVYCKLRLVAGMPRTALADKPDTAHAAAEPRPLSTAAADEDQPLPAQR